MMLRRCGVAAAALVLACGGLLGGAVASAAGNGYPPNECSQATIQLSSTVTQQGTHIRVTGCGYSGKATVSLDLHPGSRHLATVRANSHGKFRAKVLIPCGVPPGQHTVTGTGSEGGFDSAPLRVTNSDCASHGGHAPPGSSSAGSGGGTSGRGLLPFTGADIWALVAAALVLIVGGGNIAVRARGRRLAA